MSHTHTQTKTLGDVKTQIIYEKGSPEMPLVLYHPGIFGHITTSNISDIALQSGCSFLAINTIDQAPDGTYPPRHIDFKQCLKIAEDALNSYDLSNGVIPILNSWGTLPVLMALSKQKSNVKGVLGIGATLNAHRVIREGVNQYFQHGILTKEAQASFNEGKVISAPYPTPDSEMQVYLNKDFFDAMDQHKAIPNIPVSGKTILIRGETDEHVCEQDTRQLEKIFTGNARPETITTKGGHWGDKKDVVGKALERIIHVVSPNIAVA